MHQYQTDAGDKSRAEIAFALLFSLLADTKTFLVSLWNSPVRSEVMQVLEGLARAVWGAARVLFEQVERALGSPGLNRGQSYSENRNQVAVLPGQHDTRAVSHPGSSPTSVPRQTKPGNGWLRLWILVTGVGAVIGSSIYVWGPVVRYRFVSVSIAATASPEDYQLAQSMRQQASTNTFVGRFKYPPLLAFEALAKRGAVKQVSFQWLEPGGWSFTEKDGEHDQLAVLDKGDIKASAIIGQASRLVRRSRLPRGILLLVSAFAASAIVGIGAARIQRGIAGR